MSRRLTAVVLLLPVLTALACAVFSPATPTPVPPSAIPVVTDTPAAPDDPTATPEAPPSETATIEPAVTDTPLSPADLTYLAYIRAGHLLVANVTGGVLGGATQYTQAGIDDAVYDLIWSPSGEFVAFTSWATGVSHLFVVYAEGAGTPVDLGPGSAPNWSPNSLEIAYIRDDNLWITPMDPAEGPPRQLTFQTNWGWGRPTFLPDGSALMVTGVSRDFMGAQGNTEFVPQILALDGSGALSPLAAFTTPVFGRLPYDLRFSPDNSRFAFSSSAHLSACAGLSDYYVANADGSSLQTVTSPSLVVLEDPATDTYLIGTSYDWAPDSQALLVQGHVISCAPADAGTVRGTQVSLVRLDGAETFILPGFYHNPSFSPAGNHFAVAAAPDFAAPASRVQIYDLSGALILDVDEGWQPAFQP
jgi:Tol biopolymer transport system component